MLVRSLEASVSELGYSPGYHAPRSKHATPRKMRQPGVRGPTPPPGETPRGRAGRPTKVQPQPSMLLSAGRLERFVFAV